MRCSTGRLEQHHVCRPWPSWRTTTSSVSAGGATQQGIMNAKVSWSVLIPNYSSKWIVWAIRTDALLNLIWTRRGLFGMWTSKAAFCCRVHGIIEFRILKGERSAKSKPTGLNFRRADFGFFKDLFHGVLWDKALEGGGAQEKLVNIEGSLWPSSRAVHPNEQKVKQKCQELFQNSGAERKHTQCGSRNS